MFTPASPSKAGRCRWPSVHSLALARRRRCLLGRRSPTWPPRTEPPNLVFHGDVRQSEALDVAPLHQAGSGRGQGPYPGVQQDGTLVAELERTGAVPRLRRAAAGSAHEERGAGSVIWSTLPEALPGDVRRGHWTFSQKADVRDGPTTYLQQQPRRRWSPPAPKEGRSFPGERRPSWSCRHPPQGIAACALCRPSRALGLGLGSAGDSRGERLVGTLAEPARSDATGQRYAPPHAARPGDRGGADPEERAAAEASRRCGCAAADPLLA